MTNILELAESGRVEDVIRDMRVRGLYSPYYLTKLILGYGELTDYLHQHDQEAFVLRLLAGGLKQWIEWPRGFFKTTTFTIGVGIWLVLPVSDEDHEYAIDKLGIPEDLWMERVKLHDQDMPQLLAFETMENAQKKVTEIKWHYEQNELFRLCYPEIAYTGEERPWNSACIKQRRVGYGRRLEEGTFEAIGVGSALQSRHYGTIWEDDLVGEKAKKSQTVMDDTIGWHQRLYGAFMDATRAKRFGVANVWGYADLNSWVRENEPDVVFYTRKAIEIDAETGKETSIFPIDGKGKPRFTLEALDALRKRMSKFDFACQYLNEPIPPGEREVDASKIHRYRVELDGRMVCNCGSSFYPSQLLRYIHYDPYNAKGTGSTSCPAIVVVGTSVDKHIAILDYWMNKGGYSAIYNKLKHYNNTWKPHYFTYEDVGHQNMTAFHISEMQRQREFIESENRRFPTPEGVPTGNQSKELRIRDSLFPHVTTGKVTCRDSHVTLLSMFDTFPVKVPGHDYDLMDALAQGSKRWRFPVGEEQTQEESGKEEELLAALGRPYSHFEQHAQV